MWRFIVAVLYGGLLWRYYMAFLGGVLHSVFMWRIGWRYYLVGCAAVYLALNDVV